jgi:beta-glucuronidase
MSRRAARPARGRAAAVVRRPSAVGRRAAAGAPTVALALALVFAVTLAAWPDASAAGARRAQAGYRRAQTGYRPTPPTFGALYRDGQTDRYLLGGTWLYRADVGDVGVAERWWAQASTAGWTPVTIPNAYNARDFSTTSMDGYVGWYRRDFTIPTHAFPAYVPPSARRWIVRFESVNYRATVWLNGKLVGSHAGAYLPFELDLPNVRPGVNRLVVRVDDRRGGADLPPGPGGGWWNFGGLLREVYLRAVARADIAQVEVRPLLPCPRCAATVAEQVAVRNVTGARQTVALEGSYGASDFSFGEATIAPHRTWIAARTVTIARPRLWSPAHPNLYRATLTLSDAEGRPLGGYVTYSGIRSIVLTRDGRLRLNGRLLSLRGVDLHEQNIATGAALSSAQLAQLVAWVRQLGATIIRAHYPLNPQIEEAADRDGILVWSEIPVYQVADRYLAQPSWLAAAHAFLAGNILANQNHPSILLWSIGNELNTPAPPVEAAYIRSAVALAHRLDPTRPVGMAISDWPGVPCQPAYAPLQVLGFNDYFGWFDAGGGSTDDRDELSPFLDDFRACYPRKALFVTEFGFEGNRHGPVEERGTYEFQDNSIAFHLQVFASKPWLTGAMYWLLQDFAARPGWGGGNPEPDPPFVQKGLRDLYGRPKPAWALVSAAYHAWLRSSSRRERR